MTSAHNRSSREKDAEQLLTALAGVVSAHIVSDPAGSMVEIHILSTPDLHPKQVVRNVESALSAGLGIEVDRRIVSVAQIRSDPTNGYGVRPAPDSVESVVQAYPSDGGQDGAAEAAEEAVASRLEYVRFEARRDAGECTCEVTLRADDQEVRGEARGPDTDAGRAESAARAVFDAIGKARPQLQLRLEGAVLSTSRGRRYVIVSVHALLERETIPLAGAAMLSRSPEEAGILAALQASNRWSS